MSEASDGQPAGRPPARLTPEAVRGAEFGRTPVGRRGLNEDEVRTFVHRLADEIAARDAVDASLHAELDRCKELLARWQSDPHLIRSHEEGPAGAGPGPGGASTSEAVNILSRAQQEADTYLAQTQDYCRRLTIEAQSQAQAIISDAQAQAGRAAAEAAAYRERQGDGLAAELDELERRLSWARMFVSSLETVEAQLRTAREALTYEFDRLTERG
jgi:cell division initiation protein